MKKLLLTFLVLNSSIFAFSQGSWSSRTSLPSYGRDGGVGFSIGNYGYIGLGWNDDTTTDNNYLDFWKFDPSNDSWSKMANFPDSETFLPVSFVIGNYGYVITGQAKGHLGWTNRCWEYNANTNQWIEKASLPAAARDGAVGFSIGSKGYVGMGSTDYGSHNYKDFWSYDTASNTWTQIADFGGLSRIASSGFSVGGKGYVCFGEDSTHTWHNDIWEYDPGTNSWTQKSNCPGISRYGASGFIIGNYIFVGTGQDSNSMCDSDFYRYNTVNDTWKKITNFQAKIKPARFGCSGFSINDTGYFGVGVFIDTTIQDYFSDFYRFIPDTTTAINSLMQVQRELSIFPNPTNQLLNVCFKGQISEPLTYSIRDITGREILNSQFSILNSQFSIDVSSLSFGMYFFTAKNENINITQKFIKQ